MPLLSFAQIFAWIAIVGLALYLISTHLNVILISLAIALVLLLLLKH